jgi:hypothetical protein
MAPIPGGDARPEDLGLDSHDDLHDFTGRRNWLVRRFDYPRLRFQLLSGELQYICLHGSIG